MSKLFDYITELQHAKIQVFYLFSHKLPNWGEDLHENSDPDQL